MYNSINIHPYPDTTTIEVTPGYEDINPDNTNIFIRSGTGALNLFVPREMALQLAADIQARYAEAAPELALVG